MFGLSQKKCFPLERVVQNLRYRPVGKERLHACNEFDTEEDFLDHLRCRNDAYHVALYEVLQEVKKNFNASTEYFLNGEYVKGNLTTWKNMQSLEHRRLLLLSKEVNASVIDDFQPSADTIETTVQDAISNLSEYRYSIKNSIRHEADEPLLNLPKHEDLSQICSMIGHAPGSYGVRNGEGKAHLYCFFVKVG